MSKTVHSVETVEIACDFLHPEIQFSAPETVASSLMRIEGDPQFLTQRAQFMVRHQLPVNCSGDTQRVCVSDRVKLKLIMIQEFLHGQEIGADVYIDMVSGDVVSIFTKKKIKMRAGETDKAVSFKDPALFALIEKIVQEAGYRGQIDIDIFEIDGKYYISEVNPRFGGGYPHAYEAGCDHMKLILNNLQGKANPKRIGLYDENVYMMKYNEVKILRK